MAAGLLRPINLNTQHFKINFSMQFLRLVLTAFAFITTLFMAQLYFKLCFSVAMITANESGYKSHFIEAYDSDFAQSTVFLFFTDFTKK